MLSITSEKRYLVYIFWEWTPAINNQCNVVTTPRQQMNRQSYVYGTCLKTMWASFDLWRRSLIVDITTVWTLRIYFNRHSFNPSVVSFRCYFVVMNSSQVFLAVVFALQEPRVPTFVNLALTVCLNLGGHLHSAASRCWLRLAGWVLEIPPTITYINRRVFECML